jgi:hypothetical protein
MQLQKCMYMSGEQAAFALGHCAEEIALERFGCSILERSDCSRELFVPRLWLKLLH